MVAVLCVVLHPLQVLLVTLQAPGVVFDLRGGIAVTALQSVVEALRLLHPLYVQVFLQLLSAEVNRDASQVNSNVPNQTVWQMSPLKSRPQNPVVF